MDRCYTIQNKGTTRKGSSERIRSKYRMTVFEGSVLMFQIAGLKDRFEIHIQNTDYFTSKLKDFPGVVPWNHYPGKNNSGYSKYALSDAARSKSFKALQAEGLPLGEYIMNGLHKGPCPEYLLNLKVYQHMYSPARLGRCCEELSCPICDKASEEIITPEGPGHSPETRSDMDNFIDHIMIVYDKKDKPDSNWLLIKSLMKTYL